MSYVIKNYNDAITKEKRQQASIFLRNIEDKIVLTAKPHTPKKEGNLRKDVIKQVLGLHGTLEWHKKYFSVQERGKRLDGTHVIKNYTTPGTGPHFAINAIRKVVKESGGILKVSRVI